MEFHFEELKSPFAQRMRQQTPRRYVDGMIKVSPSGCILPSKYRHYAERIRNFEVREDDVWIITYPKCGTTWTQEMVWLIMHDLDFEGAKESLFTRSPFLEFWACAPEGEHTVPSGDTMTFTEKMQSPRCIKSHLPKELLPHQLWTKKPKIIYVTRSAKDVLVSFFHHHKLINGYTGTLEEFVKYFMDENVLSWDPFWSHILEFWKMKNEPNILINSFEDMKKDLPSVIRKTATFLNKSFSEEEVKKFSEHLEFRNMKKNKSVNFESVVNSLKEKYNVSGEFMRSGEVGSASKELSKEQMDALDKWSRQRISNTDYPFVG